MKTVTGCNGCQHLVNSVVFSPVYSPPDRLSDYVREAKRIISKNDPLAKIGISPKSRRALIDLQIRLQIGQFFIKNQEKK
jgi:hypothetical protein